MMDYEMKMADIRKKNEEKLSSQKEREKDRERDLDKKRKEVRKSSNLLNFKGSFKQNSKKK